MKKMACITLAVLMVISLCACGISQEDYDAACAERDRLAASCAEWEAKYNELKASTDISSEAAAELDAILAELEETEAKLSKAEKELASTRSELDVTKANLEQAEKELAASDGQEPILELKPETITEPAKETTSVTKTIPTQKAEKEQTVWIASSGNGTKYHKSTCRTLKDGKTEITLSEAEAMGLTACKVCGG